MTDLIRQKTKIVIAGPFSAGKTQFISTATGLNALATETVVTDETIFEKSNTTVAMDFGSVTFDDNKTIYLFGTPGQERFEFMWEILTVGMHALLIIVDSSDLASAKEAKVISEYYRQRYNIPVVIGANKQDLGHARTIDQMYDELDIPMEIPIIPLITKEQTSIREALHFIIQQTDDWLY